MYGNSPAKKALTLNFSRKRFDLSMRSPVPNSEQGIAADAPRLSALGNSPLQPDLNLQFVLPGAPPIL